MTDYIRRDEALSFPFANGKYDNKHANKHFIYGCESYKEWLKGLPAADVRENVPSAWIDCDANESGLENTVSLLCENCGNYTEFALVGTPKEVMDTMRFCPRCGAVTNGGDEQ